LGMRKNVKVNDKSIADANLLAYFQ